MATVPLSTKAIGSIVKIPINGIQTDFLVVHQGKPSAIYDSSFDNGTILTMKNLYELRQWNSSDVNNYASSTIKSYLDSTFLNLVNANIQSKIVQVKIPYRPGSGTSMTVNSGANGLLCKIFLLSGCEVGSGNLINMPADGATLAYFFGIEASISSDKRIASLNGTVTEWWIRSPITNDSSGSGYVGNNGSVSRMLPSSQFGVRPSLVLPNSILVTDDGTIITAQPPTNPGAMTVPNPIRGGVAATISWGASTDPQNQLSGYIVQRSTNGGTSWTQIYQGTATSTTDTIAYGTATTATYRVQSYNAYGLSSGWTTSSAVTVINNIAPTAPSSITVPTQVLGGAALSVAWGAATSTTSTISGYKLERKVGTVAWTQIYQGNLLYFADTIVKGWASVQYQVRAYDAYGEHSGYTTSPVRTVDNSSPPTITSSTPADIGAKNADFTWQYTVNQVASEATTVVEKIDGVQLRSYTAVLGQANTFSVTGQTFLSLLNGAHTMTVTATAANGKSVTYTVAFTKAVYSCSIALATPLAADAMPTAIRLTITGSIPGDAVWTAEACNNGNDASPTWENIKPSIQSGYNYVFANKLKTAANWGVNFRINIQRGASSTGGYVYSVEGGFQ